MSWFQLLECSTYRVDRVHRFVTPSCWYSPLSDWQNNRHCLFHIRWYRHMKIHYQNNLGNRVHSITCRVRFTTCKYVSLVWQKNSIKANTCIFEYSLFIIHESWRNSSFRFTLNITVTLLDQNNTLNFIQNLRRSSIPDPAIQCNHYVAEAMPITWHLS